MYILIEMKLYADVKRNWIASEVFKQMRSFPLNNNKLMTQFTTRYMTRNAKNVLNRLSTLSFPQNFAHESVSQ